MSFQIAIDGPVASGKGTVARLVALRLGILYIDSGAMYRATALVAQERGISFHDESALVQLLAQVKIELRQPSPDEKDGRLTTVLVDGRDISWAIRADEVSAHSSEVAIFPGVRRALVALQQQLAQHQAVVMEGRDITYRVLPNAQLKIYLTASAEKRAQRRFLELQQRSQNVTYDQLLKDIQERDERDSHRATDPLQIVEGAWVLDTSDLTIEEVVDQIVKKAQAMR